MSTLSVRARVLLDGDAWLPGHPSDAPPALMRRVVTIDDGAPIKDQADVFVSDEPLLRRAAISVRIGETNLTLDPASEPPWTARASLRDQASVRLASDIEAFQLARPSRRASLIGEGATIGWSVGGVAGPSGALDFAVAALVHFDNGDASLVEMVCDSILLDIERARAELVWRGIYIDETWGEGTERILIGVVPGGVSGQTQVELLEQGLPRAVFTLAGDAKDIEERRAPPLMREEELAMERLAAWEEGPGAPTLSADEFAQISTELALGERSEVLAKSGFDEIAWGLEEWAQGEQAASQSAGLSGSLADEKNAGSIDVKPAPRRPPGRPRLDITEYARLLAHLEAREPGRVLAEAKLSVRGLFEIEEVMNGALESDKALADELERLRPTFQEEAKAAHAADLAAFGVDPEEESGTP